MSNMISNHNASGGSGSGNTYINTTSVGADSGNSTASTTSAINVNANTNTTSGDGAQSLREICNIINTRSSPSYMIPTGGCVYDHIIELMRGLSLQDDGIILNNKIKTIEADFCNIVRDEMMLCESMEYMNDKALADGDTALKFALLFSTRNFDALAMKETKVRSAMLKILETNFINADAYREHDKNRLYNSITLLGEYYHRVRLADNAPITILGESLLNLLTREINDTTVIINVRLARLILSQITLNGEIMRTRHKMEIDQLLYHIRRHLIMQPAITAKVKAMLLMVLDLFYSHFKHIGFELEAMYTDYLVVEEGEEDCFNNNNNNNNTNNGQGPSDGQSNTQSQSVSSAENCNTSSEPAHDSFELQLSTKKWSEQVCEDSLCEIGFAETDNELGREMTSSVVSNVTSVSPDSNSNRHNRRAYQPRHSPRPLHNGPAPAKSITDFPEENSSMVTSEDRDETKPLPSWRKTRFNRTNDGDSNNGRSRTHQRRYSGSFDDDRHSVRSDGGNLRLYSIHDRRKHSQERYERNFATNFSNIVNSNWDQRDDRSERSYISNYERGNYKRGGRFHNRNTYDKPPRFQKQQQQQQQHQHQQHQQQQQQHYKEQKIRSETWRRSSNSINSSYHDENCANNSNGPESNSRSSSRARTLPRPPKSQMDDVGRKPNRSRYSQSPSSHAASTGGGGHQQQQQQQPHQRNLNSRYSSQSSLASEPSTSFDRRQPPPPPNPQSNPQQQRHRNFTRRLPHQQDSHHHHHHHPQEAKDWEAGGSDSRTESEIVRNAQQTTKYMNYLSAQK